MIQYTCELPVTSRPLKWHFPFTYFHYITGNSFEPTQLLKHLLIHNCLSVWVLLLISCNCLSVQLLLLISCNCPNVRVPLLISCNCLSVRLLLLISCNCLSDILDWWVHSHMITLTLAHYPFAYYSKYPSIPLCALKVHLHSP